MGLVLMATASVRHRFSGKVGAGCSGVKSSSASPFPAPTLLARKERVEGRVSGREYMPSFATDSPAGPWLPLLPRGLMIPTPQACSEH